MTEQPTTTEHLQPSFVILLLRIVSVLLMMEFAFSLLLFGFLALNNLHSWHIPYFIFLVVVNLAKIFFATVVLVRLFVDWAGLAYYITGHHLIQKVGLVNVTETTFELSQLKSLTLRQGWMGRKFNFGTIDLTFSAYGDQQGVTMREVNDPEKYKKYFDSYLEHYLKGEVR